jgi:hypothetical protein
MNYPDTSKKITLGDAFERAFQTLHKTEALEAGLFERWTTARQEAAAKGVALNDLPVTIKGKQWTRADAQEHADAQKLSDAQKRAEEKKEPPPSVGDVAEEQGIAGLAKNKDGRYDYEAKDIDAGLADGSLRPDLDRYPDDWPGTGRVAEGALKCRPRPSRRPDARRACRW